MEFKIEYYKKNAEIKTIEIKESKSLLMLKRWYKSEFEKGNMKNNYFIGFDIENNKNFAYSVKF